MQAKEGTCLMSMSDCNQILNNFVLSSAYCVERMGSNLFGLRHCLAKALRPNRPTQARPTPHRPVAIACTGARHV